MSLVDHDALIGWLTPLKLMAIRAQPDSLSFPRNHLDIRAMRPSGHIRDGGHQRCDDSSPAAKRNQLRTLCLTLDVLDT